MRRGVLDYLTWNCVLSIYRCYQWFGSLYHFTFCFSVVPLLLCFLSFLTSILTFCFLISPFLSSDLEVVESTPLALFSERLPLRFYIARSARPDLNIPTLLPNAQEPWSALTPGAAPPHLAFISVCPCSLQICRCDRRILHCLDLSTSLSFSFLNNSRISDVSSSIIFLFSEVHT